MEVLRHLTENLRSHQASYVGLLGYCTVLWCLTKVSWHLTRSLGGCLMRSFGNYGLMAPYGIWYRYLIMYLPRYLLLSNTFCCCCFQNTKSKNQIKLKYNFIFWTTLIRENYWITSLFWYYILFVNRQVRNHRSNFRNADIELKCTEWLFLKVFMDFWS